MKNHIYTSLLLGLLTIFSINVFAQTYEYEQFKLKKETKIRGTKIFFTKLINTGDESQIDVNKIVEKNIDFFYGIHTGIAKKKIQNHISWMRNPLFEQVQNKSDADVVVGGTYAIKTDTKVEEKLFYERTKNIGGAIPYYEIRQINKAQVIVVISYTYKDNTVDYDTIKTSYEYERKPKTKYQSIDKLLTKCKSKLNSDIYHIFHFYDYSFVWYKFRPVKTKDKNLKTQLKTVKELLAKGDVKGAGTLYLKAYQLDNGNLNAAYNVAQCYELLGNYPKANEFYTKSPDFHAKVRMKSNMILYNYLHSINAIMTMDDF